MPHGFVGGVAKSFGRNGNVAHHEHAAGVAMPPIFDDSDVNVDDVTFFQGFFIGDAMANLMVDGGANGFGIG